MALVNGLIVVTPTSVVATGSGSSATINGNGSVTFASCATLSLNGVFTSAYDNYKIVIRNGNTVAGGIDLRARLRVNGTDSTSVTDYNTQELQANLSSIIANRQTSAGEWNINSMANVDKLGTTLYLFAPALSLPTSGRSVTVSDDNAGTIYDNAITHEQTNGYDGLSIYPQSGLISGLLTVFAFNQ